MLSSHAIADAPTVASLAECSAGGQPPLDRDCHVSPPPERHSNALLDFLHTENWTDGSLLSLRSDLLAGLTLGVTQVAPCVAYAILGGASPSDGLRVSAILLAGCALFGGRPGMLSSAAGAVAPLLPEVAARYGFGALGAVSIATGLMIALVSVVGLGRYVRAVPAPVLLGFLDGLGIILLKSQFKRFQQADGSYYTGSEAGCMAFICMVSFATMMLLPRVSTVVPSAFAAVCVGTILDVILRASGHGTVRVEDLYQVSGTFSAPSYPDIDFKDTAAVSDVLTTSVIVAVSACIETFLCAHLLDRATATTANYRREGLALGASNILNGFLGGFPGCAVIGPSLLNADMGAATRRVSCLVCGILLMLFYVVAAPAINLVPIAALAAVVFGIGCKTFDWGTIEMIFLMRIPVADSIVLATTVVVSVVYDLALGVGVGFVLASLFSVGSIAVAHSGHGWLDIPSLRASLSEPAPANPLGLPCEPPGSINEFVVLATPRGPVVETPGVPLATGPNSPKPSPPFANEVSAALLSQIQHVHMPVRGILFFGTAMSFEDTVLTDVARRIVERQSTDESLPAVTDLVLDGQDGALLLRDVSGADALREVAGELHRQRIRCHIVGLDIISLSILRELKRHSGGERFRHVRVPQLEAAVLRDTIDSRAVIGHIRRRSVGVKVGEEVCVDAEDEAPPPPGWLAGTFEWSTELPYALPTAGPLDADREGHVIFVPVVLPWSLLTCAFEIVTHYHRLHLQHLERDVLYAALEELKQSDDCLMITCLALCFNLYSVGHRAQEGFLRWLPLPKAHSEANVVGLPRGIAVSDQLAHDQMKKLVEAINNELKVASSSTDAQSPS